MKKYIIKYWIDEESRNQGNSEIFSSEDDLETAIMISKNLFYKQNFACVEVDDKNYQTLFHISNEIEETLN